jgi:hypothetical protein
MANSGEAANRDILGDDSGDVDVTSCSAALGDRRDLSFGWRNLSELR